MANSLALFHPLIRDWFEGRFGVPTLVQQAAWPRIANAENLLITAPTGSGKTLTAFLMAINQFVTGRLVPGTTRVLYISPLKALNNDIERNLASPLAALKARFAEAGEPFPAIRVQTRSGDTDPSDRRRMVQHPPEILITTPESLNLLLSSKSGLSMLTGLRTVILDEIHDVVASKRGVYLMSAVERLVPLSGEFQRLALSATVRPLDVVAHFVGGYQAGKRGALDQPRAIAIIDASADKRYDITIRLPQEVVDRPQDEKIWDSLAADFVTRIRRNRATLFFTNSRALCEKIAFKINEAAGTTLAWAHHGSLAKEIRLDIEQKLKDGELAAIVATSTLEMGIDIGSLDEVVLIQSPAGIASAIQRIGRAGHGVGETSRCTLYPTHPLDFVEAAVLGKAVLARDIEPIRTIDCPLDVLAQIIISMTGVEAWDIDELFVELTRSTPFHGLSRTRFDLVVDMLAGRYAENHIRELKARVDVDRLDHRIKAKPGALMALYLSGGVIPDRGYFQLRHEDNDARIGELDEEFVWEATIGKVFSFGTQHWRVRKITHNDVIVAPAKPGAIAPPFWKSEPVSRNFHYASRIGEFLEHADARLEADDFGQELVDSYRLDPAAANQLREFLLRQRAHCQASLPHRHHLLVERVNMGPGRTRGQQVVLHTQWGAKVNRPLAMALEAGWHEAFNVLPSIHVTNESLVIQLPGEMKIDDLLALAPAALLEQRLRRTLEGSGFFGARFRENAGRALLLAKGRFNERKPLWMSRLQSQKLLDAVMQYDDFPLLLETWRTCLQDEFDVASLRLLLQEIDRGEIRISEVETASPSPFAQSIAWAQVNTYMYMDDTPRATKVSRLSDDLLQEVVFTPELRPQLPAHLVTDFEQRRQRLIKGYEPEDGDELVAWVKERTAIPLAEWRFAPPTGKLTVLHNGDATLVVALEDLQRVRQALTTTDDEAATRTCIANWLQYYGPISGAAIAGKLGVDRHTLEHVLTHLTEQKVVVFGHLVDADSAETWCDAANYEALLRSLRRDARQDFQTLPGSQLPVFLWHWQSRNPSSEPGDLLFAMLERYRCLPLPADFWEAELLPCRMPDYQTGLLDSLFQEGNLVWVGSDNQQVTFCNREDLELMPRPVTGDGTGIEALLPDHYGRYDFGTLMARSQRSARDIGETLWRAVWAGAVTNDSVLALRKGIQTNFAVADVVAPQGRRSRMARPQGFQRWRGSIPFAGNWYRLPEQLPADDLLLMEEQGRDRVRILIDRYGILFRELLLREAPEFRWRNLFRSIRLMELSGELLSGYFFEDIPGPQFVSPASFRLLQSGLPQDRVYCLNALDPVSLAGIPIDALKANLPRRVPSNHMVYRGPDLLLVSERQGRALTIYTAADDPHLPACLTVLHHLANRAFQPVRQLAIETINGVPAPTSEYLPVLAQVFKVRRDHKLLHLERHL